MNHTRHFPDDEGGGGTPPVYQVDLYFANGSFGPGGGSSETLPRNDDFDEETRDAAGNVVDDTQINFASNNIFGGNRVVGDEEIREVNLSIAAAPNLLAKWQMTHSVSGATTVWMWWENGNVNKPWPHWGLMTPGYSAPTTVPVLERFRVEGMIDSATPVDDLIQVEVQPLNNPPSSVVSDSVTATVTPSNTPPQPPANVTAMAASETEIAMSWQPPQGAPAGTTYDIYRWTSRNFRLYAENTRFHGYVNLVESGWSGTSFTDTGLEADQPYYYRITANVVGTDSQSSNEATATPGTQVPEDWGITAFLPAVAADADATLPDAQEETPGLRMRANTDGTVRDLVRIDLKPAIGHSDYVLDRTTTNINVWSDAQMTEPLLESGASNDVSLTLASARTVWRQSGIVQDITQPNGVATQPGAGGNPAVIKENKDLDATNDQINRTQLGGNPADNPLLGSVIDGIDNHLRTAIGDPR